jgi:hypothetical protein
MRARALRHRLLAGAAAIIGVSVLVGPGTPPLAAQPARPVEFRITERLRVGEVAERVTLRIQGRTVGSLAVDRRHPEATLAVRLPRSGRYGYALASTAVFEIHGERHAVAGRGAGIVEARAGDRQSSLVTGAIESRARCWSLANLAVLLPPRWDPVEGCSGRMWSAGPWTTHVVRRRLELTHRKHPSAGWRDDLST